MIEDPRYELNKRLKKCCPNVYYRPGENATLEKPCITYVRRYANQKMANNASYGIDIAYWVTIQDVNGENDIQRKLYKEFPGITWQNEFIADGINHSVLLLYYRI